MKSEQTRASNTPVPEDGGRSISRNDIPGDPPPPYTPTSPRQDNSAYSPTDNRDLDHRTTGRGITPMTRPPYLPPLTKGQKIKSGPYTVTATDSMVLQRERQNREIYQAWIELQQRAADAAGDDYYAEFKQAKIRRTFIKKVFFILFIQFLFTTLYISFFMFHEPATIYIKKHWYLWIIALMIFMTSYCTISMSECGRQKSGWGGTCLILLTLAESHLSAYITVQFEVEVMLITMGTTALVTFILTLAATCCKFDFTKWAGLLGIFSMVLMITLFLLMFTIMFTHIRVLVTIFGALGALVISMYLYFDVQTIMGGRKIELGPDEVIFATTQLYVDIMGLYRYLLIMIGAGASPSDS